MDDVIDDIKFLKRKFSRENPEQSKDPSVGFLMKKQKDYNMSNVDADYIRFLNGIFAPRDPKYNFSSGDDDDDPDYVCFLYRSKKDGTSHVLEAVEKHGLTMPLRYEEVDESDEDVNSLPITQWMESESADKDYAYFLTRITTSSINKLIYEDGRPPPVVYNGDKSHPAELVTLIDERVCSFYLSGFESPPFQHANIIAKLLPL